MKHIFLIGAGRSAGSLIEYLEKNAEEGKWRFTVGESNVDIAWKKLDGYKHGQAVYFDVNDQQLLSQYVRDSDLVISLLPAHLHYPVARMCVHWKKNIITASYVSEEIQKLNEEAKKNGVLILMETGLDPGIDHMSAMAELDGIRSKGGELTSFKSFTGGLVAPESDTNPWKYKITWNPRNVVLAGQGTVKFIRNGKYKYIPYHNLFRRTENVSIKGYGNFEGYANRDSLKYRELYGLEEIPTLFRGTLRREGFCEAWNIFVQLGMTEDTYWLEDCEEMRYRDFLNTYLAYDLEKSIETKFCDFFGITSESELYKKVEWLGLFSSEKIGLKQATPAQVLQKIIEEKWKLEADDKDMIVMQHQFEYKLNGQLYHKTLSMVVKGDNAEQTSMSKTVGLPLGIAAKLLLTKDISLSGVQIPTHKEIYQPILDELENWGIVFEE